MSRDPQVVGHHLHQNFVGHLVTVRTPGDIPHTGVLVAVGMDRLVVATASGVVGVTRLLTTHLEAGSDSDQAGGAA